MDNLNDLKKYIDMCQEESPNFKSSQIMPLTESSNLNLPSKGLNIVTCVGFFPNKEEVYIPSYYDVSRVLWRTVNGCALIAYNIYEKKTVLIRINSNDTSAYSQENSLIFNDIYSESMVLKYLDDNQLCIKFVDEIVSKDWHIFITEYPDIGALHNFIVKNKGISNNYNLVKLWIKQLVHGVYDLHVNKNLSHFDINPQNLYITKKYELKLTDFSQSLLSYSENSGPMVLNLNPGINNQESISENSSLSFLCCLKNKGFFPGTPEYISPELLEGEQFDAYANDVWSIGCVIFFIITGRLPFKLPTSNSKTFCYIYSGQWLVDKCEQLPWLTNIFKGYDTIFQVLDKIFKPENERLTIEQLKKIWG